MSPYDYLSAHQLAGFFNVTILTPDDIPGFNRQSIMKLHDFDVWSAITLKKDDLHTIIVNSDHSDVRKESDLFHELAHIICGHKMLGFKLVGSVHLRKYNKEQEDEAEWLGGCLHIPRKSLEWAFRNNMTPHDICTHYTSSNEMLTYRINVTGIKNQYKYYASEYL